MPKVIYGSDAVEPEYSPPRLFPDLRRYAGEEQTEYILEEIERMINDGSLSVTDMLAQPSYIRDRVGLALKNQYKDPESLTHRAAGGSLPAAVAGHVIKIRSLDGRPVRYKSAVVQRARLARTLSGRAELSASVDGAAITRVAPRVAKWIDYEAPEAEIPLPEAWVCMAQHGKYCRPAKSLRTQAQYWIYEEVRPQKRGPGRPRKSDE